MKRFIHIFPALVALMGAATGLLRFCLYLVGTDEKGLLVSGHPLEIILWLLTAAAVILILLQVWPMAGSRRYAVNFPASTRAAAGCFLFAAGIFLTVMANRQVWSTLEFVRNIACLAAVPALTAVAICRRMGKRPLFGFHAILCLALTLHTVSHYRAWSACPQLQDSFFPMMGCLGLMLFSYYQTAFDVGLGSRRMQLGTGALAAFCCFAAIPGSGTVLLYLTGGIWTLTNLCALKISSEPAPDKKKEDAQ